MEEKRKKTRRILKIIGIVLSILLVVTSAYYIIKNTVCYIIYIIFIVIGLIFAFVFNLDKIKEKLLRRGRRRREH
jgi:hypothetical protein